MNSADKTPVDKSPLDRLSTFITPSTAGVIWLTDSPLNTNLSGVYEFNYLTNGLLTKSIQSDSDKSKMANFFVTDNFGNPFFLSHLAINSKEDIKKIYTQMELAKPLIQETINQVYVFNKSTNTRNVNILKELLNRYEFIDFQNLNI